MLRLPQKNITPAKGGGDINNLIKLFLLLLNSFEQNVLGVGNGVRNAAFLKRNVQVSCRYRKISPPPKAGVI